jgi:hypothetical protein
MSWDSKPDEQQIKTFFAQMNHSGKIAKVNMDLYETLLIYPNISNYYSALGNEKKFIKISDLLGGFCDRNSHPTKLANLLVK